MAMDFKKANGKGQTGKVRKGIVFIEIVLFHTFYLFLFTFYFLIYPTIVAETIADHALFWPPLETQRSR